MIPPQAPIPLVSPIKETPAIPHQQTLLVMDMVSLILLLPLQDRRQVFPPMSRSSVTMVSPCSLVSPPYGLVGHLFLLMANSFSPQIWLDPS